MARNKQSIIDDLIDVVTVLPCWVGVVLALISYFPLHDLSSIDINEAAGFYGFNTVLPLYFLHASAFFGQFILPFLFLFCAFLSAFRRYLLRDFSGVAHEQLEAGESVCPQCGSSMVKRDVRVGASTGYEFWICTRSPDCHGSNTLNYPL